VQEIYPELQDEGRDAVLVQGVIDCLIIKDSGLILIDYKTGHISASVQQIPEQHYIRQLHYYTLAMERILEKPVIEKYLYFFDSRRLITVE